MKECEDEKQSPCQAVKKETDHNIINLDGKMSPVRMDIKKRRHELYIICDKLLSLFQLKILISFSDETKKQPSDQIKHEYDFSNLVSMQVYYQAASTVSFIEPSSIASNSRIEGP